MEGGCSCGSVRYRLADKPAIVHCCHCSYCQRETGSAFAVNALIEASQLEVLSGDPEPVELRTASGKGQRVFRCPQCRVALWSIYNIGGGNTRFVRAGTLDDPSGIVPDVHVHIAGKQHWVVIPDGAHRFDAFYRGRDIAPLLGDARAKRLFALFGS
ncbi:MAG TPA: GFA family protein [Sphingomonadaceae bacterium]|nr:GFA family protein [Sphingomonadaceae bacterium]